MELTVGQLNERTEGIRSSVAALEEASARVEEKTREIDRRISEKREIIDGYEMEIRDLGEEAANMTGEID